MVTATSPLKRVFLRVRALTFVTVSSTLSSPSSSKKNVSTKSWCGGGGSAPNMRIAGFAAQSGGSKGSALAYRISSWILREFAPAVKPSSNTSSIVDACMNKPQLARIFRPLDRSPHQTVRGTHAAAASLLDERRIQSLSSRVGGANSAQASYQHVPVFTTGPRMPIC